MTEFWRTKQLQEMTASEWELLCDGCAKCCLVKLEDEDTGEIYHTDVACKLLNLDSCRCTDYASRQSLVDDCLKLEREAIDSLDWLPDTCAYRLIAAGKSLPDWHHLITGDRQTVHRVGASVKHFALSELEVDSGRMEEHIIRWVD